MNLFKNPQPFGRGFFEVYLKIGLFAFSLHTLSANLGFLSIHFFGLKID